MKKKIIILIPTILIIILLYIDFINFLRVWNIGMLYHENWNIEVLNPYKINYIIKEEGIDSTRFVMMYYKKNKVNKMLNNKTFKKVNKEELNQIYSDIISKNFINSLNEKDKKLFNQVFNKNDLFNENNYYVLLEKGKLEEVGYCFELLLLDTNKNIIYSIVSTS